MAGDRDFDAVPVNEAYEESEQHGTTQTQTYKPHKDGKPRVTEEDE
ncbi:MAG TPA: hypothetical protein VM243_13175 [Phycisphaerae bacterium]|nr:hypothetical protein [Phycisphaerae bacterium]